MGSSIFCSNSRLLLLPVTIQRGCAPTRRLQRVMQQPGDQAAQLIGQQSISATFARGLARGKGLPLPYGSKGMVQNAEYSGYTVGKDVSAFGGLNSTLNTLIGVPMGLCAI